MPAEGRGYACLSGDLDISSLKDGTWTRECLLFLPTGKVLHLAFEVRVHVCVPCLRDWLSCLDGVDRASLGLSALMAASGHTRVWFRFGRRVRRVTRLGQDKKRKVVSVAGFLGTTAPPREPAWGMTVAR